MRRLHATSAVAVIVLAGACTPTTPPVDAAPSGPPMRTTWQLRHRVVESADLRVDGQGIDQYDEDTTVSLGAKRSGDLSAKSCSVSVSVPGQGGPDDMVGEKVDPSTPSCQRHRGL